MTANDFAKLLSKWIFGLWMAGLGTYLLVAKVAVWPAIGMLAFGMFILNQSDLDRFALWFKDNASGYLADAGGRRASDPDHRPNFPPSEPKG